MLRFYHTAVAGGNALSYNGTWDAFDLAEVDGTNGESAERQLILAPAKTALTNALAASSSGTIEIVRIDHAIFQSLAHPILLVDSEKLKIVESGGFGELNIAVERGYDSTAAAAHDAGAAIVNCYNYQTVSLGRSGAQASWLTLAPDAAGSAGSYASSLAVGALAYDESYTFWRKITVAASTSRQRNLAALPTLTFSAVEALKAA